MGYPCLAELFPSRYQPVRWPVSLAFPSARLPPSSSPAAPGMSLILSAIARRSSRRRSSGSASTSGRPNACRTELTQTLTPRQLRYLNRQLRDVRRGFYDPDRLTVRDLIRAASGMADNADRPRDGARHGELRCLARAIAAREAAALHGGDAAARRRARRPGSASARRRAVRRSRSTARRWSRRGATRTAWFRLIDPRARAGQSQHLSAAHRLRRADDQLARPAAAGGRRPHLRVPRISGQSAADRRRHGDGDRLPVALPGRAGTDRPRPHRPPPQQPAPTPPRNSGLACLASRCAC